MPLVTAAQLQLFARKSDYMALAPKLDAALAAAGITSPREIRHFMAQMYHESLGFTRLEEDLSYRAERLHAVWPKRFPTVASAQPYAMNPRALAEKVYGGRLGNVRPGDGYMFRGRGLIMLTGRDAYRAASAWCGVNLEANPAVAADMATACKIAVRWWQRHGLGDLVREDPGERRIADIDAAILANEVDDCRQARQVINGGQNGIDDAITQLRRAATIWRD